MISITLSKNGNISPRREQNNSSNGNDKNIDKENKSKISRIYRKFILITKV